MPEQPGARIADPLDRRRPGPSDSRFHPNGPDDGYDEHDHDAWLDDDIDDIDDVDLDDELDDERQPGSTRLREKKARHQRRLVVAGRGVVAAVAAAVLVVSGFAWGTRMVVDERFRQVSALDPQTPAIVDADKQAGDENFLLIGSDTRAGAAAEEAGDGGRSDAVMLAHIPADRSRVVVVSFPRDVEIDRPACEQWDATTGEYTGQQDPGGAGVKLNTAYQVGGPRCATRVVQQLSGLGINHFVGIEFSGFAAMVDAVGGVRVCAEQPVVDEVLGPVVEQPGEVELTGATALDFVRAAHVGGDPSADNGRIRRQQRFVAALMRAAMSDRVLSDPRRLSDLVGAMADGTYADNVGVEQLAMLGRSLDEVGAERVTFVTAPTAGVPTERGNEQLRAEDTAALFRAMIDDAPLPHEQAAEQPPEQTNPSGPVPVATVPPDQIKLQVLNGTGAGGLAGQIARRLRTVGFQVVKVDNAKQQAPQTVIRYSATHEVQARTVAAAVPGAQLQVDPSMGGAVELVLGTGFDGTIEAVQLGEPVPGQPAGPPPATGPAGFDTVNGADTSCS